MLRVFLILLSVVLLIPIKSSANNQSNIHQNQWNFMIAPYAWVFGTKGSMTVKGTTSNISTTPIDTHYCPGKWYIS